MKKIPYKVTLLIRSLLFDGVFYGGTLLMAIVWMPFLILPRKATACFCRLWSKLFLWSARTLIGVEYTVEGLEHLPKAPYIIASKHQSMWETIAFLSFFDDPAFILKRSLRLIPFVGWIIGRLGVIGVHRGASGRLDPLVQQASRFMAAGRPVIIFPEGTRVSPDVPPSHRPYKKGLWYLYKALKVPVVPISLNAGVCWPRRAWLKKPGHIRVVISPPLQAQEMDMSHFHHWLSENIEKLSTH